MNADTLLLRENMLWLKWRLVLLIVAALIALTLLTSASIFRNSMRRLELSASTDSQVLNLELREIEESERIIVENIDRFNSMVNNSVMDEENRITLLQEISDIRNSHKLFPIDIGIAEQRRTLLNYDETIEYPDEQITLRSSRILLRMPLLHEEDLTRFLDDFLSTGRLIITEQCTITKTLVDEINLLDVVEHQLASCSFYWLTLRREPFTGI